MKKLYYLIGYPASGKTTLAKALKETGNYDYVSTDDIFDTLFRQGLKYSEILAKRHALFASEILNKGQKCPNIILDTYSPYKEERARILALIPPTYEKIAVIMNTNKENCIKYYNKRSKLKKSSIPGFAYETIEQPTLDEFNRIIKSSDLLHPKHTFTQFNTFSVGIFNKIIIKRIYRYFDESFSLDGYDCYVFRIHHIMHPNYLYTYTHKHKEEILSYLKTAYNIDLYDQHYYETIYPNKFIVLRKRN